MNKIRCFAFSLLCLSVFPVFGANPKDVKNFVALAPDTVEQGKAFVVTYKLTSSSWKAGALPLSGNGFQVQDVKYSHVNGRPYSHLLATVTYLTSATGQQMLPGMTVPVGNTVVRPDKKTIFVKKNSQYGEEMSYAHDWLVKHGKPVDSLCLTDMYESKEYYVFEDLRNKSFCVIAKKAAWSLVGVPVLAYSTDNYMNIRTAKGGHLAIINVYNQQIAELRKGIPSSDEASKSFYKPQQKVVEPLLGSIEWGQNEPYNRFSPTLDGKKTVVGCVPLAVTMLMNYHQWPAKGQSHCYYQDNSDKIYKLDFTTSEPQWSIYRNNYEKNDSTDSSDNLSKLLTFVGLSIDANFKSEATSANLGNVKHVMCNNMGYSGKMAFYQDDSLTESQIESIIYRDLDQNRPLIVSNKNHAFICDGYKDGFLHYNLGWHGQFNGYYRLKLGNYQLPSNRNSLLLIKALFCGIEPERSTMKREVTLQAAGTLSQQLTGQEKREVTSLIINGSLNSSDISLIRQMAGAANQKAPEEWTGSLSELNLENAVIITDKQPYLTEKATGGWTHWISQGTYSRTTTYNFDTMTEKEWKSFKSDIGTKQDGKFYTRTDDNRYWVHYNCQKNIIGENMFAHCTSLRRIVLPQKTKKIGDYAFLGCVSLQTIRIPEKTEETGKIPFYHCTSLEQVEAPRGMKTDGAIGEECSPALRQITRY